MYIYIYIYIYIYLCTYISIYCIFLLVECCVSKIIHVFQQYLNSLQCSCCVRGSGNCIDGFSRSCGNKTNITSVQPQRINVEVSFWLDLLPGMSGDKKEVAYGMLPVVHLCSPEYYFKRPSYISNDLNRILLAYLGLWETTKLGSLCRPFDIPSRQGALCDAMSTDFHINCKMWMLFQVFLCISNDSSRILGSLGLWEPES